MARLIRTEKEVEGRYTETWIVVEEDALDQWPQGAQRVVGREATRVDGHERARGEARYTADIRLPGMLHTALLGSPYPRARVRSLDASRAAALAGVRAVEHRPELVELEALRLASGAWLAEEHAAR